MSERKKSAVRGPRSAARYVVANPRGIPEGRHILRNGERRWFEGDPYDGEVSERLVRGGFIVEVTP